LSDQQLFATHEIKGQIMKKYTFYIIACSLSFLFSCATLHTQKEPAFNSNDIVRWSDTTKLSWDDFTGEVPANTTLGSEVTVVIPAEFHRATFLDSAFSKVECFMVKKSSWAVKTKTKKQVLAYHQIFFDLYELSARKLRKQIAETNFKAENPVGLFDSIRTDQSNALEKTLSRYRSETESGMNTKKMMEWAEMTAKELTELEDFKLK
jgi:hypothetical protein